MGTDERTWIETNDHPRKLLEILEPELLAGRLQRKWRLYLCACARRLDHLLLPLDRDALDVAERFADGRSTIDELLWTRQNTTGRSPAQIASNLANKCLYRNGTVRLLESTLFDNDDAAAISGDAKSEFWMQAALVKEIFGNPFRPIAIEAHWRSATVLDLTRSIYRDGRFDLMPFLGDALLDTGCDCDELIQHCHDPAPHVRGCWAVDLLLGKTAPARRFTMLTPTVIYGPARNETTVVAARIGF